MRCPERERFLLISRPALCLSPASAGVWAAHITAINPPSADCYGHCVCCERWLLSLALVAGVLCVRFSVFLLLYLSILCSFVFFFFLSLSFPFSLTTSLFFSLIPSLSLPPSPTLSCIPPCLSPSSSFSLSLSLSLSGTRSLCEMSTLQRRPQLQSSALLLFQGLLNNRPGATPHR